MPEHRGRVVGSVPHAPTPVVNAPELVRRYEARGISPWRTGWVRAGGLTIAEADGRSSVAALRAAFYVFAHSLALGVRQH